MITRLPSNFVTIDSWKIFSRDRGCGFTGAWFFWRPSLQSPYWKCLFPRNISRHALRDFPVKPEHLIPGTRQMYTMCFEQGVLEKCSDQSHGLRPYTEILQRLIGHIQTRGEPTRVNDICVATG